MQDIRRFKCRNDHVSLMVSKQYKKINGHSQPNFISSLIIVHI